MPWFDGTFSVSKKECEIIFPNKIAENVFADKFARRGLILFDMDETSKDARYATIQPYDKYGNNLVFYFPIFGEDASKIAKFIKDNCLDIQQEEIKSQREKTVDSLNDDERQYLFPHDQYKSELLSYSSFSEDAYVFLLVGKKEDKYILLGTFEFVNCLNDSFDVLTNEKNQYTPIPLKKQMYCCPVCGAKSLEFRGYFEICRECGWEDDGADDIDIETLPNGDWTIKQYRINYFKNKMKNPLYRWWNDKTDSHNECEFLLNTSIEDLFKKNEEDRDEKD